VIDRPPSLPGSVWVRDTHGEEIEVFECGVKERKPALVASPPRRAASIASPQVAAQRGRADAGDWRKRADICG
jgi:hypothetical protein